MYVGSVCCICPASAAKTLPHLSCAAQPASGHVACESRERLGNHRAALSRATASIDAPSVVFLFALPGERSL